MLIVYNFCPPPKQKENHKKPFTATFLVYITDVAQMMCMFYILKKVHFYYLQIKQMCGEKCFHFSV